MVDLMAKNGLKSSSPYVGLENMAKVTRGHRGLGRSYSKSKHLYCPCKLGVVYGICLVHVRAEVLSTPPRITIALPLETSEPIIDATVAFDQ